MFRTFIWYVLGWLYMTFSLPLLLMVKIFRFLKANAFHDRVVYWFTSLAGRFLIWLSGSSVAMEGLENIPFSGPVVFVSNHQGHMDSAIIQGYIKIPKGFVTIVEALKFPILSSWMKHMHCVFMDRANLRQSVECIYQGIDTIKKGHSMVIFPEGRLSDSDNVNEFKRGSLKLALKPGVPIIPVTICGSYKMMRKDGSRVQPYHVKCIISKPIPTAGITREQENELMENVRNIILHNLGGSVQADREAAANAVK